MPPTVTRHHLIGKIAREFSISRAEAARLLESFFREISDCLVRGDAVKLSSFGSFQLRHNRARIGRNPKTGEEVAIAARRALIFKPSRILKDKLNRQNRGGE